MVVTKKSIDALAIDSTDFIFNLTQLSNIYAFNIFHVNPDGISLWPQKCT